MSPLGSSGSEGMAGLDYRCMSKGDGVVTNLLKRFQQDIAGATAIEYALIGGLISIAVIGGATTIGTQLAEIFTSVQEGFPAS